MTRSEKIIAFLKEHGASPGLWWQGQNFTEKHFFNNGELILVRIHHNLNDMIEVFHVDTFFCAGDNLDDWRKMPDLESCVLHWLEEMLESKPLSSGSQKVTPK
jgi:hypothetical protein